jgi:hypothetical protein
MTHQRNKVLGSNKSLVQRVWLEARETDHQCASTRHFEADSQPEQREKRHFKRASSLTGFSIWRPRDSLGQMRINKVMLKKLRAHFPTCVAHVSSESEFSSTMIKLSYILLGSGRVQISCVGRSCQNLWTSHFWWSTIAGLGITAHIKLPLAVNGSSTRIRCYI